MVLIILFLFPSVGHQFVCFPGAVNMTTGPAHWELPIHSMWVCVHCRNQTHFYMYTSEIELIEMFVITNFQLVYTLWLIHDPNNVLLHALCHWRMTPAFHDLCFLPSIAVRNAISPLLPCPLWLCSSYMCTYTLFFIICALFLLSRYWA